MSQSPPSKPDSFDLALFLTVLLYADLTVEEMFCLILMCEEICGRSAKSHYSPPCSAALHGANLSGRGKKKKKMRVSERERETEEEHVLTLPDRRVTKIPNKVNVIKVNWLQLDS